MSNPPTASVRRLVAQRAGGRCEYCLIHERDSIFTFQCEHIISEKHGGATTSDNLAYACVFCNRYKGSDVASISPTTGEVVRLYHPRKDRWADHFQIIGPLIVPITAVAEATARLLRFNDDDRVLERKLLQTAGLYPESAPE